MRCVLPARLFATLLLLAVPLAARAQVETREGIYLQNQIQELKRDIAALRDAVSRGGGGSALGTAARPATSPPISGDVTATLLDRVGHLEEEVRTLRGRVDEMANAQQRTADDVAKQIDDLNFKLDNSGARPGTPPTAPPKPGSGALVPVPAPVPGVTAPAALPPRRTAEVALQEGNAALARRDYAAAEGAAREVLANPKSPRGNDAQFLLAQALYGRKDYQDAAVAYDDSYKRARAGAHAQDSLLGVANAFVGIGEKRAACATLDKLRAEFPTPRADLRDQVASSRQRAGCP